MAQNSKPLALPDGVFSQLAEADRKQGFPPGTMQSLMMQESGPRLNEFLKDPTSYHYGLNAEGRRVAGHTGKVSTARGPFGILESTGKDPGYGVKPLGDSANLDEHIRFAADYLKARGLSKYGEGAAYEAAVVARRDGTAIPKTQVAAARPAPVPAPVVLAQAQPQAQPLPAAAAVPAQVVEPVVQAAAPAQVPEQVTAQAQIPQEPDAWQAWLDQMRSAGVPPTVAMDYGRQPDQTAVGALQVPDFMAALAGLGPQGPGQRPNFGSFGSFGGKGRA